MEKNRFDTFKGEVYDQSRRKLLKKAYVAPTVAVLGSMTFAPSLNAQTKRVSGGSSSSSLNAQTCRVCFCCPCCC